MSLLRLRWLSVILVLGHVRGIQYDVCGDVPTSFSPMCDLGGTWTLDDFQGKVFNRCMMKKCNTAIMRTYDPNLGTIEPFPEVLVNQMANFTCSAGHRMASDWFTFDTHIDHTRLRSSLKNCTSAEKCFLDRPPKCLPVRCATTQYGAALASCANCTKLSGNIPVNPSGGIEYFVYGVHTLTMQCPLGQSVQGHCNTNQFEVRCQDNGQISWAMCVPAATCRRRRDLITHHIVGDDPTMPAAELAREEWKLLATMWTTASRCTYALPPFTTVLSAGWSPTRMYESGSVLQVTCTSGNAFFNTNSFSLTKSLECVSNGTHTGWKELNLAGADCVQTCPVPNSDHNPAAAVTVGVPVTATCKIGYRAQVTSTGLDHSTCSDPQALVAACQATPGRAARLDKECMKVTCGNVKAYPESVVTICNSRQSPDPTIGGICAPTSRFSDFTDETGRERERTRIDCGTCFRANDDADLGLRWYYRECLSNCQFDLPAWNCTRLRCGTYRAPANARIISPSNWQPTDKLFCGTTELTVACNTGYVRKGSPPGTCETSFKVTCNNDRQIVNADETCVPPFCAPIANPFWDLQGFTRHAASFAPAAGLEPVAPGSRVAVMCLTGYRGISVNEASCSDSTSFQALCTPACVYESEDRCRRVVCSLNNVPNLVYDAGTMAPFLPFQSSFQASCQVGYRIGTHDHALPRSGTLFCGPDCGFMPECKPVSCGKYLPPSFSKLHKNSAVVGSATESVVYFDETLTVICDDGYIVEGTVAPACSDRFTVMCGDDGSLTWTGTGRCMPRICDCPGAGECVTTRISCGRYTAPLHSKISPGAQWTATLDYSFGDKIDVACDEGYVVTERFPGRPEGSGPCSRQFRDECLPVGMFRSEFEVPCQRLKCPTPGHTGLVRVPANDFVYFGETISQSCEVGYEPTNKRGEYVLDLPLESTCLTTCMMSEPLTCLASQCGMYGAFDYSEGVEDVKQITRYREQLQITCKPNYMLDERPWCTTGAQTEADACIPIKNVEPALTSAFVLGTTVFSPPASVLLPAVYPVTGVYGEVTVRVPSGAWPAGTLGGLSISAIEVPFQLRPVGLKTLAGPAINFGPPGIQFLTYVGISLPFTCPGTGSCEKLYAGKTIKPHKLVDGTWVEIEYAAGSTIVGSGPIIDFQKGIVQGQTRSFSTYAAVAVINDAAPPDAPPGQSGGSGGSGGGGGGGGAGGGVVVARVSTTAPLTTAAAAVLVSQGTTPPPKIVGYTECMPCATKPEFSTWTGITDCDFKCQDGTQNMNGRCVPCETTKPANAIWLSNCRWSCEPGLRVVEGKCSPCALQKPMNSSWVPGADCKWECGGGFQLSQGDCAKCSDGKDFRSRWTQGCEWECNVGYTRSETGCAPCAAKDAQSNWASASGCEWTCNPGFVKKNGACIQCDVNIDDRGRWLAQKNDSDRACTWVCEDGFYLLKKSENRISMPVGIALGVIGGIILTLLVIRVVLWRRARAWGRSLAVDEAKAKGDSMYVIPFKEPASGRQVGDSVNGMVTGDVYDVPPRITNGPKEPKETEEERIQREAERRRLKRARKKPIHDARSGPGHAAVPGRVGMRDVAMMAATKRSVAHEAADEIAI